MRVGLLIEGGGIQADGLIPVAVKQFVIGFLHAHDGLGGGGRGGSIRWSRREGGWKCGGGAGCSGVEEANDLSGQGGAGGEAEAGEQGEKDKLHKFS